MMMADGGRMGSTAKEARTTAEAYVAEIQRLCDQLISQMDALIESLIRAYDEERMIFLIGNGGSAANASHLSQDLSKGAIPSLRPGKRFQTVCLADNTSLIMALANDEGYATIFEQQLLNLAHPGDILVAVSSSGNSPNIIRAMTLARNIGISTIGVLGSDGGRALSLSDVVVHVRSNDPGMVEAVHSVAFHLLVSQLRQRLESRFPSKNG